MIRCKKQGPTSLTNHCLKLRVHFITPLPAHKPCPPHFAAEAKVAAGHAAKHLPADCGGWPKWSTPFAQFRSAKYLWFLSHAVRLVALQLADYPAAAVLLDAKQKSSAAHPSTTNRLSSQNRLVNKIMWYLLGKSSILRPGVYCMCLVLSPKSFRRLSACVCRISWERDKLKTTLVSNIVVSTQVQVKADTPLSFTSHCLIILGSKPSFARLSSQSLRADLIWSNQNWTTKTLCESSYSWQMETVLCASIPLFLVGCFLFLVSYFLCCCLKFASQTILTWNLVSMFENSCAFRLLASRTPISVWPNHRTSSKGEVLEKCHHVMLYHLFFTSPQKIANSVCMSLCEETKTPFVFCLLFNESFWFV